LITGGDSGIGRAVAISFSREGADVAFTYLQEEQDDAQETREWIEKAGRRCLAIAVDLREEKDCTAAVERTVASLGGLDVLIINAGYQRARKGIESIPTVDLDRVFKTNLYAAVWLAREAVPHLHAGSSIISTTSIQASSPTPDLMDYAMTKAALVAFTQALAQELTPRGIRVNAIAPGPIWTPLIPGTGWEEKLEKFGQSTPMGRAGQPAELASTYVFLASPEASYISGAVIPVTGGRPF
jgi:NAD(P)-dependent dehydrogenase (short-subunit alcohol dehydrogenase family)